MTWEAQPEKARCYRVSFRLEVDSELLQGVFETQDDAITLHFTGEPIWVVYVPRKPYAMQLGRRLLILEQEAKCGSPLTRVTAGSSPLRSRERHELKT